MNATLTSVSKYKVSASAPTLGMLRLACARSRSQLVQDENELSYLTERLQQVGEKETTALAWRDTFESWQALIRLRSEILVERGQAVLECIISDEKVLLGLGAAHQLYKSVGDAPDELLMLINEGPGAHIRTNAYRYRLLIDKELVIVRRLKELQLRFVGLVGSLVVASFVGIANFVSQYAYSSLFGE